jgi:hypothetical protein
MSLTAVAGTSEHFYNTGASQHADYNPKTFRRKPPKHIDRRVIAWDMEGISLSGQDKPQHPVLFGCSVEPKDALVSRRLHTRDMLEYIADVGSRYPHAIHVGYGFKYDANMIIYGLTERQIVKLWKTGNVTFRYDDDYVWNIHWIPGKMFTVTKRWGRRRNTRAKVSVTIYDYSSFFQTGFLAAAEQILRDDLSSTDRAVIAHGKAERGNQGWDALHEIRYYWECEIDLIRRVFERFRDVMYRAGFALTEWYGPGALANYINASRKLRPHMAAAQITSGLMPREVHEASKRAFSGGRFELFQAGRISGPIYATDIGSAYPYALTKVPSLHEDEGQWMHVEHPKQISRFGVYRLRFAATGTGPIEYRAMPLFWRDNRGMISYPNIAHGWYWSPEAALAMHTPGVEVLEGWEWHSNEREFPWRFLLDMYDTRIRLGKSNLLSMPFKLGPNSLYGKYAQTVGWDQKKRLPPKSHALPVAGWVTSYCRAMLYAAMLNSPASIVAVETDAIYTTADPSQWSNMKLGKELGDWDVDVYDEMVYVQSGMYHYKKDGEWKGVRSRGMNRGEYPYDTADQYMRTLKAGPEPWSKMELMTRPRFIGAGAAMSSTEPMKEVMTSWRSSPKKMALGDTGKRIHIPKACPQCLQGLSPNETPHRLAIHSRSDGEHLSYPRRLPWEQEHTKEVQAIREQEMIERELITR